jgi:hypothetical protein
MTDIAKPQDLIRFEAEAREIRLTKLETLENRLGDKFHIPGSIIVFVGRHGTPALATVRKAMSGDAASFEAVSGTIRKQFQNGKQMGLEDLAKTAVASPVFADLRYAGVTLNTGIFLPQGVDLAPIVLPYNGGELAAEGFTLAEHILQGAKDGLEAVAVVTHPKLSKAELASLTRVDPSQLSLNVGSAMWCETTAWAVVSAIGDAVTLTLGLACLMPIPEHVLTDAEIAACLPFVERHIDHWQGLLTSERYAHRKQWP